MRILIFDLLFIIAIWSSFHDHTVYTITTNKKTTYWMCLYILRINSVNIWSLLPEVVESEVNWPWACLTAPTGAKKRQSGVCGEELLGRSEAKRQSSPLFWPGGGTQIQLSSVPTSLHFSSFILPPQLPVVSVDPPTCPIDSCRVM